MILALDKTGTAVNSIKSLLVDGGRKNDALQNVIPYVSGKLGTEKLGGIISTHYDQDHVEGLNEILQSALIDNNTVVLDRGVNRQIHSNTPKVVSAKKKPKTTYVDYAYSYVKKSDYAKGTKPMRIYNNLVPKISTDAPNYSSNILKFNPERPSAAVLALVKGDKKKLLLKTDKKTFQADTPFNQAGFNIPFSWAIDNPNGISLGGVINIKIVAANGYVRDINNQPMLVERSDPRLEELEGGELAQSKENQGCLGFVIEFGNFRYYCGGDLEETEENELVGTNGYLNGKRVHAMKLSHHGSEFSSSETFLSGVRPAVVFISNGINNSYGHPPKATLDRLTDAWSSGPNTIVNFFLSGCWYNRTKVKGAFPNKVKALNKGNSPVASYPKGRIAVAGDVNSTGSGNNIQTDAIGSGSVVLSITQANANASPLRFNVKYRDITKGDDTKTYDVT